MAPDGEKVAIETHDAIVVLGVPSGEEMLRVENADVFRAFGAASEDLYPGQIYLLPSWSARGWSLDGTAFLTQIYVHYADGQSAGILYALVTLDGRVTALPPKMEDNSSNLSPDTRYIVRGYGANGTAYHWAYSGWRHIDIIDFETEEVLWSVEPSVILSEWNWEWASVDHFAWSDRLLPRVYPSEFSPDARADKHTDVSVLDVRTGETELLDIHEYLARFHSPRATSDCPQNPGHACRILLDGEVVGEGRWPQIIGFVELD